MTPSSEDVLRQRLQTGFLGIIAFSLVLFLLFQARFVLICLAIAVILFSLTSDAIHAISTRLKVPNWLATTLALIGIWQVLGFNMVLFLASEASAWITGQTYPVNGGFTFAL